MGPMYSLRQRFFEMSQNNLEFSINYAPGEDILFDLKKITMNITRGHDGQTTRQY